MSRPVTSRPTRRHTARFSLLAVTVVVALGALIGSAVGSQGSAAVSATGKGPRVIKRVAKKANNATLGKVILVTLRNRTLYTLSDEVHGNFSCTGECLRTWPPLIVGKNVKPRGPVALGRIRLADGRFQVTFRGHPLYTFVSDTAAGQANGEGLKIGEGVWRAASIGRLSAQPGSPPAPPSNPYPY